jgi:hypothetical protein
MSKQVSSIEAEQRPNNCLLLRQSNVQTSVCCDRSVQKSVHVVTWSCTQAIKMRRRLYFCQVLRVVPALAAA